MMRIIFVDNFHLVARKSDEEKDVTLKKIENQYDIVEELYNCFSEAYDEINQDPEKYKKSDGFFFIFEVDFEKVNDYLLDSLKICRFIFLYDFDFDYGCTYPLNFCIGFCKLSENKMISCRRLSDNFEFGFIKKIYNKTAKDIVFFTKDKVKKKKNIILYSKNIRFFLIRYYFIKYVYDCFQKNKILKNEYKPFNLVSVETASNLEKIFQNMIENDFLYNLND